MWAVKNYSTLKKGKSRDKKSNSRKNVKVQMEKLAPKVKQKAKYSYDFEEDPKIEDFLRLEIVSLIPPQ